ncbi:glycosyl transferase [Parazoarcus communis]|uniref:Glycosyl transferase n=1 Tax=Parazoarcus communis TaxID=41977 RepID=A0A2U8H7G0_9RHOO|nr:glycosyltransferase family 2 protein [Parazoarcus communis]AWI81671.1 glycosyl transferase [Parazoarcus communis]
MPTVNNGIDKKEFKVGIVTVLYKSNDVIKGFIDSINNQTFKNFHVLYVENDVNDFGCESYIKNNATHQYTFIRNKDNYGVAKGNNQGIDLFLEDESYTHILFLNNDIEIDQKFLQDHIQLFSENSFVDALAPKMVYHNTNGKIWYAGGKISYLKGNCRHFGHNKKDRLTGKVLFKVDYAPTCSLMIKSLVLRETQVRMWEELFVYYDDTIFCSELCKKNVRMYYTPTITLSHKISSSTGGNSSDFSRYYLTRNWLYWGIKAKNPVVIATGMVKYLYYLIFSRKIELKAMRDAFILEPKKME